MVVFRRCNGRQTLFSGVILAIALGLTTLVPTRALGQSTVSEQEPTVAPSRVNENGSLEAHPEVFDVLPGFQVELLYTVPKQEQGSWVSIAFDPKGRLLASDQGDKGIYRITPPAIGSDESTRVEKLNLEISSWQGMVHAFDNLYLSVNGGPGSGLYRARDTDGDDQYDELRRLKPIRGGGEHGPHAVRISPDGKSLYVIAGNHTDPPEELKASRVPMNWSEDLLLPRQWDARGHARGRLAPGGWIAKTDPDGANWEIISIGYRNAYDMAFNADGELFAYDADMEWDMGMPWYRPTRAMHATSGSDFGWRSGTGKWPTYYADSLPPLVDIGPGSPVGACFGTGAKFPARYQAALYLADWTFGTIYAVHNRPQGASYVGEKEEFVSRRALPLTDVAVGPDGALYFTVGGRGTQSALYRVTYVGNESTDPADTRDVAGADLRKLRRRVERFHQPGLITSHDSPDLEFIHDSLGHDDRHIRFAARVALEHQPIALWRERVQAAEDTDRRIQGVVALVRAASRLFQDAPKQRGQAQHDALAVLEKLEFNQLTHRQKLDALRALALTFIRLGPPDVRQSTSIAARLTPHFPSEHLDVDRELARVLVYLNAPGVVQKCLDLMAKEYEVKPEATQALLSRNRGYGGTIAAMLANQPEIQKLHYAFILRNVRYGWTLEERKQYLNWLNTARARSGGASYAGFIDNIRKEALANVSADERDALEAAAPPPPPKEEDLPKVQGPGREWSIGEVVREAKDQLHGRDFENGRKIFAAVKCMTCHRFDGRGGATGPDLTSVSGRFGIRDLAESMVQPSKVVSDQYRASVIETDGGKVITGRIVAEDGKQLTVQTHPEDANQIAYVGKGDVRRLTPSPTSLMPEKLLDSLNREEVLDLFAYLLSRGNPQDLMFADEGR